jgi:hypothetical protein
VINGLIIWFLKKDSVVIPFGGDTGFAVDIAITAFLLLFCVAAIVIGLQRKKLEKGELASFRWDTTSLLERFLARLPRSAWGSGLLFGLVGLCIVAPLTLIPMSLLGITEITPLTYTVFKGFWAGGLAALIMPSVIMVALAEERVSGIASGIE